MQHTTTNNIVFLNNILDSINEGIVVFDKNLKVVRINKWYQKKLQNCKNASEVTIGLHCYKTSKKSNVTSEDCPIRKTFVSKKSTTEILNDPFVENNNSIYVVTTYPMTDDNGDVEYVIEHYSEITHLKKIEKELLNINKKHENLIQKLEEKNTKILESEEKYNRLYNNAPIAFQSLNLKGKIIDINATWLKILNYKQEEVIGKPFIDFIHPEYVLQFKNNFHKLINQGNIENVILKLLTKDKKEIIISIEGSIEYLANKEIKQLYCTFKDITKQVVAEKALEKNRNKIEKLFDVAPSGIGQLINRIICDVNRKICEITGYNEKELIGQSALMLYPNEEEYNYVGKEKYEQIKKFGSGLVETKWKCKNGNIINVILASTPLETNNIDKGTIFTVLDITQNKKTELQLKKKNIEYESLNEELRRTNEQLIIAKEKAEESNRLKTEFLNNMSHEIRTPMNGIMGFSDMLTDTEISDEKKIFYAKIVQNSSSQLLRVIDDILEISTLETKQIVINEQSFNLNDLLMELFTVFNLKGKERNINIYVNKELQTKNSNIISDKSKLNKILSNLLENAIKYTNEGFVEIGYFIKNNTISCYVKDSGVGIDDINKEIIFERFSQVNKGITAKNNGLGLGLSISKENAELLGGNITLESRKNIGSTFYVNIPYKGSNDQDNKENDTVLTANYKKRYILIAEDEEVNYFYLEALLENQADFEFKLIHAKNGKEAVEICSENPNIELVLMDIKMPIMNGLEATKKIKSVLPKLPIIAQTAYSTVTDRELSMKSGCNNFISKPIQKDELLEMINKYL